MEGKSMERVFMDVAQILNIAGLFCEFVVLLVTSRRVFLTKEKAKEKAIEDIGQPLGRQILSERDLQVWVFALLFFGLVLQITGILLS